MSEEIFETPQPIQPTGPKPADWPKIILATVLGLGLLAASAYAGYWYGSENAKVSMQNAKKTPAASQPTPTPEDLFKPTPTPTEPVTDPTTEWEVYTSPWYGYRFAYPPTWGLSAPSERAEITTLTSVRKNSDVYPLHDLAVQTYIGFTTGSVEQNLEILKESTQNWVWEDGYPNSKIMQIGGKDVWTLEGLMKFADDNLYWRVYSLVPHKNAIYELSWWDTPQKSQQQVFDQILSTFKFLE